MNSQLLGNEKSTTEQQLRHTQDKLTPEALAEWVKVKDRAMAKVWYLKNTTFTNEQIEQILDWMEDNPEKCTPLVSESTEKSLIQDLYLKSLQQ